MSACIGIDVGTSACRACAIDTRRRILAETRTTLPPPHSSGPAVEQDPEIWWQALLATLDSLADRIPGNEVSRIALDGTSSTVLLCRPDGTPVTPGLLYNDTRAVEQARRVREIAPQDSPAQGASASLAKLLWLKERTAPQPLLALHQADWLSGRLTGRFGTSDENNALKTGYDPVARRWAGWLDDLDLGEIRLPEVVAPGSVLGPADGRLAERLGWPSSASVVAGTTDSTAGFIATGASRTGTAVTSLGSTLVIKVLSDRPVFDATHGVYSHRLGDRWLAGGASSAGGSVLRKYFGACDIHRYSRLLQPDHPTGLDYYPLLAPGERFPVADPALPPRLEPRPVSDARFFQGILEGLAAIEERGYRLLAELGAPWPREVLTVGGGAVNRRWEQIRQQRLRVPVRPAEHQEAAYGAALLALGLSETL